MIFWAIFFSFLPLTLKEAGRNPAAGDEGADGAAQIGEGDDQQNAAYRVMPETFD
jgi:hypothetical protein